MAPKKNKRKKKKAKLTPQQLAVKRKERALKNKQRTFRNKIVKVFKAAAFEQISTQQKNIVFEEVPTELDNIFIYKHIVVIAEDTCLSNPDGVRDHLLKKSVFYKKANEEKDKFIEFLDSEFPEFKQKRDSSFQPSEIKLIILYCSFTKIDKRYKDHLEDVYCLEQSDLEYFSRLARAIGKSIRFEIYKFLGVEAQELVSGAGMPLKSYDGFVLPETPSGFPQGFKVATLYIDPDTLISLSYVLRKDGWLDVDGLYQRMISPSKLASMRRYLAQDSRVFINNVIVSFPSSTKLAQANGHTLDLEKVKSTTAVKVQLVNAFNTIGIIDGQHRVFAYHEGNDALDAQIAVKRQRQQLLVTGIIYPEKVSKEKQLQFEAQLFLEINDKQTKTRPELRQAIESIVNPFSVLSISRTIANRLASTGPLTEVLEEHFFDTGRLKSSSIVSFGLKRLVKIGGNDSLFQIWKHPKKSEFGDVVTEASTGKKITREHGVDKVVLEDYVAFCTDRVNDILTAYRSAVPKELWTLDKKVSRALTTTAINGVIFGLRELLRQGKTATAGEYVTAFKKLKIEFVPKKFKFTSSNWGALGQLIVEQCFSDE